MRQIARVFPFVCFFDLANGVTTFNIVLSFTMVVMVHQGELSWAASIMCLATMLDFIDGHIARTWLAGDAPRRAFGKHLDSFSDLLNFSIAPAIALILLLPSSLAVIAGSALVMSGVLRLAVFAINAPDAQAGYRGLPTTYSGLLFALAFQSMAAHRLGAHDVLTLMFVIALFQVTNLKFPKFKAVPTVAFIATAYPLCSFLLYNA